MPDAGIQGTIGGGETPGSGGTDGRTPGSPTPPSPGVPGRAPPAGAPQAPAGSGGFALGARSWVASSGATSTGAGCPVSLQRVIDATSAGRAQSAGFLLP